MFADSPGRFSCSSSPSRRRRGRFGTKRLAVLSLPKRAPRWRSVRDTGRMTSWISGRLLPRDQRVMLSSPLPPDAAALALSQGVIAFRGSFWLGNSDRTSKRVVRGTVTPDRIRLSAGLPYVRNSWRPILRAQLLPTADGCQLIGTLGLHPVIRVFILIFIGNWCLLTGVGLLGTVATWGQAGPSSLGFVGAACVMTAAYIGLSSLGNHLGRRDADYLQAWLANRLEVQSATTRH